MSAEVPSVRWRSPEEIVEIGFERSRVVMMNEAHNGLRRCVRTRDVGRRVIPIADRAGVRHVAMEALNPSFAEEANRRRVVPQAKSDGYLAQPEMRDFIKTALACGWTLIAYEVDFSKRPRHFERLSRQETNWREEEQARRLGEALASLPARAKLFVWCGNGHFTRIPVQDWLPMGYQFERIVGIEPFAIDQTRTVEFSPGRRTPWAEWTLPFTSRLESLGGTAGFLREEEPATWPTRGRVDVDAFLLSTDNSLT
ncbi:MAG TPA: hypothetical protein VGR11_08270 [Solirubrobacteraceae bacterium]|nr:hypothetical protein [Solirubrobacteraceae bacterium]